MSERIDHAAEAIQSIVASNEAIESWSRLGKIPFQHLDSWNRNVIRDVAIAQVHATLALVEQQRVANLIALNLAREPITMDSIVGAERKLKPEIKEALGL